jgi:hypothetical protein
MKPFLMLHRNFFLRFAFLALVFTAALYMTACGVPAWLTDAGSIIALVGSSFTSIAAFVAGLTGNAALAALLTTVSKWITTVQTGISDLQALITQYQASPSTGLLAQIESALTDLKTNVQQDFSNLGLPPAVLTVIAGIAALAANTLAEWDLAIQGIKTAPTSAAFKEATAKLSAVADALPQSIAAYKVNVNKILTTKTGDPMVDAALAKTQQI